MVDLAQHTPYFYQVLLLLPHIEFIFLLSFYLSLILLLSALLLLPSQFLSHQFQLMEPQAPRLFLGFQKRGVVHVCESFGEVRKSLGMGCGWAAVVVNTISSKLFGFSFELLQHVLLDDVVAGLILLYHSLAHFHSFKSKRVLLSAVAGVFHLCPTSLICLCLLLNAIDSNHLFQQTAVLLIPFAFIGSMELRLFKDEGVIMVGRLRRDLAVFVSVNCLTVQTHLPNSDLLAQLSGIHRQYYYNKLMIYI